MCNVERDPAHEQTAGFSVAELQILEFNLSERSVQGAGGET
jgi:hypothetical protein